MAASDHDAELLEALAALAHPSRLRLIRALRTPKILQEIQVRGESPAETRPLARQTVKEHLDRLLRTGLVLARDSGRAHPATSEYVVNHQVLYSLSEEMRALARVRATVEPEQETAPLQDSGGPEHPRPGLVVVKGLEEGYAFDLSTPRKDEWTLGRRREADIALDFDPFVSSENARILRQPGGHAIQDLPGSRNGTRVNFRRLPLGATRPLAHGDVIGVGRTLLVYWR